VLSECRCVHVFGELDVLMCLVNIYVLMCLVNVDMSMSLENVDGQCIW